MEIFSFRKRDLESDPVLDNFAKKQKYRKLDDSPEEKVDFLAEIEIEKKKKKDLKNKNDQVTCVQGRKNYKESLDRYFSERKSGVFHFRYLNPRKPLRRRHRKRVRYP